MWNKQPNNFQGQLFLPFKNSKSRKSQKSILHKLKNDICIQRSFLLDLELLMVLWFTRVMSKVSGQRGSVWTWVTGHFNLKRMTVHFRLEPQLTAYSTVKILPVPILSNLWILCLVVGELEANKLKVIIGEQLYSFEVI